MSATGAGTRNVLKFRIVGDGRPADEIVAQIRARIASQALKVGDKLPTERDLEAQLGVSRNSIRQALKSLADTGLLEIRKGATGGAFVTGGSSDAVNHAVSDLFHLGAIQPANLTEVRVMLGTEVARLACLRATEEEIAGLEANIEAAEAAVRARNDALRTKLNLEFHRLLARMTHNPLLVTLTDAVMAVTEQFGRNMPAMASRSVMPLRRRILGHLRTRDAGAATEEMREHLLRAERHYLKYAPTHTTNGARNGS